jgi:ATP-dependent DNA helicase RecG
MEDMHVVENRGSGIKSMLQALRDANLEPPTFDDRRASFLVTFRNHTLLNPEAIAWLNQFADCPLNDRQRLALVYLRQHVQITNPDYRRLNRVDPLKAGHELRGLVDAELVHQEGAGRWTAYRLKVSPEPSSRGSSLTDEQQKILEHVRQHGTITNTTCRELLSVDDHQAYYLLRKLSETGLLTAEGKGRWRKYVLR